MSGLEGELRYDKFYLVWVHDGEGWIPVNDPDSGMQVTFQEYLKLTEKAYTVASQFRPIEDPSKEDPRIAARLEEIRVLLTQTLHEAKAAREMATASNF